MDLILDTFGNTAPPSTIQPKQDAMKECAKCVQMATHCSQKIRQKSWQIFFKWKKAAMKTEKMQPPNIEKNLS